jgi:lambda repressor-like predicted transcriptional regulator
MRVTLNDEGWMKTADDVMERSRGAVIQARLDALGVSVRKGSEASGLHRKTLARAIADDPAVLPRTYAAIERWLDMREAELARAARQAQDPDPHVVTFELSRSDEGGTQMPLQVVVSGPVENIDALTAAVELLISWDKER